MASTLNSTDTGSGGLITTGDSSDELQLQTAETTAITITSGQQSAFIAGTASAPAVTTTGDLNTGVFFPAADNIGFATNGVIRGRWTTDGLCFGSDTAAANALDDYEEGSYSPVITGSVSNPSITYNTQVGNYIKIGRLVTVFIRLNFSAYSGGSGDARVSLPLTSGLSNNQFAAVVSYSNVTLGAGYTNLVARGLSTQTFFAFETVGTGIAQTNLAVSGIGASSDLIIQITYQT